MFSRRDSVYTFRLSTSVCNKHNSMLSIWEGKLQFFWPTLMYNVTVRSIFGIKVKQSKLNGNL